MLGGSRKSGGFPLGGKIEKVIAAALYFHFLVVTQTRAVHFLFRHNLYFEFCRFFGDKLDVVHTPIGPIANQVVNGVHSQFPHIFRLNDAVSEKILVRHIRNKMAVLLSHPDMQRLMQTVPNKAYTIFFPEAERHHKDGLRIICLHLHGLGKGNDFRLVKAST